MARLVKVDEILGRKEGQRLEFKRAAIAENSDAVIRAVVGMLNATGGRIVIGVMEANGVGHSLESVPEVAKLEDSLRNRLLDTVHPRDDLSRLVSFSTPQVEGKTLLVLDVKRSQGIPRVFSKGGAFYPLKRFDNRLRTMTYEQLVALIRKNTSANTTRLDERFDELVTLFRKERGAARGYWLGLALDAPAKDCVVPLENREVSERVSAELMNPTNVNIRRAGWTWYSGMLNTAKVSARMRLDRIECGRSDPPYKLLRLYRDGTLTLTECLEGNLQLDNVKRKDGAVVLMEMIFLEYTLSLFRLAAWYWRENGAHVRNCPARAEVLFEPSENTCLPSGQGGLYYQYDRLPRIEDETISFDVPYPTAMEIIQRPDAAAFRVIERFYAAYGHSSDKVPFYNSAKGEFILP